MSAFSSVFHNFMHFWYGTELSNKKLVCGKFAGEYLRLSDFRWGFYIKLLKKQDIICKGFSFYLFNILMPSNLHVEFQKQDNVEFHWTTDHYCRIYFCRVVCHYNATLSLPGWSGSLDSDNWSTSFVAWTLASF